jgi:protein O-GlcNAc transferase
VRKKHPNHQLEAGLALHRAGNLAEAAKTYRQLLSVDRNQPHALHFLGVIAQAEGQFDDAVALISESLRIQPANAEALNDLAGVVQGRGCLSEAAELYDAALAVAPHRDHLHSNRGEVMRRLGRFEDARKSLASALELNPNSHAAHSNLGTLYIELRCYSQAEAAFRRALAIKPDLAQSHCNLGVTLRKQGKYAEADECFRRALAMQPRYASAHIDLGASLKAQGRMAEAEQSYWRALEIDPRSDLALNNLGNVFREQGAFPEAIGCFQKAIAINPNSSLAHNNLGSTLIELERSHDAVRRLQRALVIRRDYPYAHNNLGVAFIALGRVPEAVECFRCALEIRPDYSDAFSNFLLAHNYLPDPNRDALFAEHLRFDALFGAPLRDLISPHMNEATPTRRLRIGYVSGDLREHPVAYFIRPVFEGHNREDFEVFCYANQPRNDAMSEQLRQHADRWRNVASVSDEDLANAIRQDQIDILVDLSGHTARNRLLVFARKPAPIQVTMIGYMQTTGLATMDYRITDEAIDPVGTSEQWNTEKLVRLQTGAATFRPPADCPPVNELPALTNGYVTFGSFNNLAKVTPDVIRTWARILHCVPTARLLLVAHAGASIAEDFYEHGIGADRLEIVHRLPMQEYLALHHKVDLLLDTFPYNGGTTSLLALWMGVPFVTLSCDSTVGRVGGGMLPAVGLPELVTSEPDQYLRSAVNAVSHLPQLSERRRSLRERMGPMLGDGRAHTSELERAYRNMWLQWCETKGAGADLV